MNLKNASFRTPAFAPIYAANEHDPLHMREPRLGDGTLCRIFSNGTPRERCFAPEGDPAPGGNDPPPDAPKFTQKDVDAMIGKRVGEATKKFADYDALKTQAATAAALQAERDALAEEKANNGRTAEEKAAAAATKAREALERAKLESDTKLTAAERRAESAEKALRTERISVAITGALSTAKALPQALAKASSLLMAEAEFEIGDDGKIASVTYGGVAHKTPAEAAIAFLKDNDFLAAAASGGGGGSGRPNGSGGGNAPTTDASAEGLLSAGFARRQQR